MHCPNNFQRLLKSKRTLTCISCCQDLLSESLIPIILNNRRDVFHPRISCELIVVWKARRSAYYERWTLPRLVAHKSGKERFRFSFIVGGSGFNLCLHSRALR